MVTEDQLYCIQDPVHLLLQYIQTLIKLIWLWTKEQLFVHLAHPVRKILMVDGVWKNTTCLIMPIETWVINLHHIQ